MLGKKQKKIGIGTKIVIDTNIFVSALITPRSNSAKVLRLWEDNVFEVLVSGEILSEISEVLSYPKIKKYHDLNVLSVKKLLGEYADAAFFIKTRDKLDVIKEDPSDNKFLECALAGKADFIVSGDKHLLNLKVFGKITILNPREFLERIEVG